MIRSLVVGVALLAGSLQADVTIRYKADVTSPLLKLLPPDIATQVSSLLPFQVTTRLKAGKTSSQVGSFAYLNFPESKQIVLLDTTGKKFVKSSTEELVASLKKSVPAPPSVPGAAGGGKPPEMPTPKVESRMTGRTATVMGVACEEREVTISVDTPPIPNLPSLGAGPFLKVVILLWTSEAAEADRVPAINELTAMTQANLAEVNPAKGLESLPQIGGDTMKAIQDMSRNGVLMKLSLDIYLPGLAPMLPMLPGAAALGPSFDPKGSLLTMTEEVVELNGEPLAASMFEVPPQYTSETVDDFMKDATTKLTPPRK